MRQWRLSIVVGVLALFTVSCLVLAQEISVLEEKTSDGIAYVSGGIGIEERGALSALAKTKEYNLKLEFIMISGQYTSGATVMIQDASGKTVLQAESDGPWFYAKLPPGDYTFTAALGDQKRVQRLSVEKRLQALKFYWK